MSHPRAILTDLNCDPGDNFWQPPKDAVFQKEGWKRCITPAQTDCSCRGSFHHGHVRECVSVSGTRRCALKKTCFRDQLHKQHRETCLMRPFLSCAGIWLTFCEFGIKKSTIVHSKSSESPCALLTSTCPAKHTLRDSRHAAELRFRVFTMFLWPETILRAPDEKKKMIPKTEVSSNDVIVSPFLRWSF